MARPLSSANPNRFLSDSTVQSSNVLTAVAATTAVQALVTMASLAVSVFAPQASKDIGVAPESIGIYASLTYIGAMAGSLVAGGFILRYGAVRFSQIAMLLSALGLFICTGAQWWWFALSGIIFGLGYGPITPASSYILSRHTPSRSWSLYFSIKQTGVPLGGVLAGLIVPYLLIFFPWQDVALIICTVIIAGILLLEPLTKRFDHGADRAQPLISGNIIGPLRLVFSRPTLRLLALSSFFFSATQQCFVYFLVTFLVLEIGWTTQTAGFALSILGLSAVIGRIAWGALADATGRSQQILGVLALTMGLAAALASQFTVDWSPAMIYLVCGAFGATGAAWNGVYIAEITRTVAPDEVGHATGGGLFVTFAGVMVTPPLFGLTADASGGFSLPYLFLGSITCLVGLFLLVSKRR